LRAIEAKALSAGTPADGGYLVPVETETAVNRSLRDLSPLRSIADVRQVSGSSYQKPYALGEMTTGWVAETDVRTQTNASSLSSLSFPTMELYAMPAATQSLLDDAAVDIDAWIAEEVRTAFALQEGQAFVTGDGINKPKGFLSYPTVAEGSWAWGSVGVVGTGVNGAFPASNPTDKLIDLTFSLKAAYRNNARFVMNRATLSAIRKFKDSAGQYIWAPAPRAGEPSTLLGYSVVECEDMPGIAAGANAIAFGDFRRGYLVVDRIGLRVLRDPYSAKPYVLFYTTKRVGGGIQDFDAIKLLTFAA
jgi:HK97 family phage major capsid protein